MLQCSILWNCSEIFFINLRDVSFKSLGYIASCKKPSKDSFLLLFAWGDAWTWTGTVLSLLRAHALISAHPCFFNKSTSMIAPNKHLAVIRPICSCRSANYTHKPLKTRSPGTHIVWFYRSSDILHCFQHLNKRPPKMTYICVLGA